MHTTNTHPDNSGVRTKKTQDVQKPRGKRLLVGEISNRSCKPPQPLFFSSPGAEQCRFRGKRSTPAPPPAPPPYFLIKKTSLGAGLHADGDHYTVRVLVCAL